MVVANEQSYQAEAYFLVEEKIPQKQEPLKVWTMNNDYFLNAFTRPQTPVCGCLLEKQ